MNPYYRCFEASDGFVAVACLNVTQRRAFLAVFGLEDPTIEAPDVVPEEAVVLAAKKALTAQIAAAFAEQSVGAWIDRLASARVPCGLVQQREGVHRDAQVEAERLVAEIEQDGLGLVRLLAPFVRIGGATRDVAPAPALGQHTAAVLEELR
jgi:crotonobetainyl-CoA:carnitine CoA-transferase CaiB-like acyl-CoA transferase